MFGQFENVSILILENSVQKLIDASILFSKDSFSSSYFLSIISQEEASKLYALPYICEIGQLNKYLNRGGDSTKKDVLFQHKIKQNLFNSYGIQERDNINLLETKKQNSIYVGYDVSNNIYNHPYNINQQNAKEEIVNGYILIIRIFKNYVTNSELQKEYKELLFACIKKLSIINLYLQDITNNVILKSNKYEQKSMDSLEDFSNLYNLEIITNPFENIKIFKLLFGKDYKIHLEKIIHLSIEEIAKYVCDNEKMFKPVRKFTVLEVQNMRDNFQQNIENAYNINKHLKHEMITLEDIIKIYIK